MGAEFYLIRLAYWLYRLSVRGMLGGVISPSSKLFNILLIIAINQLRQRLPQLSELAIDITSIPLMSSEPERVFSSAKHTITDQRCSLNINSIELLECLKS